MSTIGVAWLVRSVGVGVMEEEGVGVVSLGVSAVSKEVSYLYCKPYGKLRIASYYAWIFCKNHACRPKGLFRFEIIINVLVSSFRFIWIPALWVYRR